MMTHPSIPDRAPAQLEVSTLCARKHSCREYARFVVLPLLVFFSLLSSCDFPADPPLISNTPVDPQPVVDIDSARSVLPLRAGNKWLYVAAPLQYGQQSPTFATAAEVTWNTQVFYELRYEYALKAPVSATFAFPGLLQKTGSGLTLYERTSPTDTLLTRPPRLSFTLPYPAQKGATWSDPKSDYSVLVAAKDTLIRAYNTTQYFHCYRYDVFYEHRKRCSIFAVPGSAFLRIEYSDISFHTIGWWVQ
jgi:hypothetical protein